MYLWSLEKKPKICGFFERGLNINVLKITQIKGNSMGHIIVILIQNLFHVNVNTRKEK